MNKNIKTLMAAIMCVCAAQAGAADFGPEALSGLSFSDGVRALKEQSAALGTPAVSTAAPVSTELQHFMEELGRDVADSVCRNAQLKLNRESTLADVAGLSGGFRRRFRRYADGKLALLDEANVTLISNLGNETLHLPNLGALGVNISAVLDGRSQVVRPLESDRYCKEMKTLFKLREVKTIIPATAGRIAAMKNGELWKLPITLHFGFSVGAGANVGGNLAVSVSAGTAKERKPSVTLYRMDEGKLRLRLRLDRVSVRSSGISLSAIEVPFSDIGQAGAENLFARELGKEWAREANKNLAFRLSFGRSTSLGKRLLLEFILDPRDQAQMAGLEKFLRGDLGVIKRFIEMGLRFDNLSEDENVAEGAGEIEGISGEAGQTIGAQAAFAGSNLYHGHGHSVQVQLPILHNQTVGWGSAYNRYQSLARDGETLHAQSYSRTSNAASINIPFIGSNSKYDSSRGVTVVNRERKDGSVTRASLMYNQYEGFVSDGDNAARYMMNNANGVLKYVGRRGDGVDNSNTVPAMGLFPPDFGQPVPPQVVKTKLYDKVIMSFSLMINANGVEEVVLAPANAILRAYLNMMREAEGAILDKVADLFSVGAKGEVSYDRAEAARRLGASALDSASSDSPLNIVHRLAYTAACVISDIASARDAAGWKERSEKLAMSVGGRSRSGLKYEDFLKVAVQLVSPENVSAAVYVLTDKGVPGEADVAQTYRFFNTSDNSVGEDMTEVTQMANRFAAGSELTD